MKIHSAKRDTKRKVPNIALVNKHTESISVSQFNDHVNGDDFMSLESSLTQGEFEDNRPNDVENNNNQMHPGLLLDLFAKPIIINPAFATITQNALASLLLSYLAYASEELSEEYDGWIHKTTEEWSEWTGMSRFEQASARKILTSLGITQETRAGMPAKLYMRVNFEHLYLLLNSHAQESYAHLKL